MPTSLPTIESAVSPKETRAPESTSSILRNRLVLSILVTETAERIAYYGFRAVLVLYFTHGLQFSESMAVSLCAATVALAYFSPLVGAILADSSWGRFYTIWRFGVAYGIGLCLLTLASLSIPNYDASDDATANDGDSDRRDLEYEDGANQEELTKARTLTFIGLFLVCMGTGGIKPCVSAFGADQVAIDAEGALGATMEKQMALSHQDQIQHEPSQFQDEPEISRNSSMAHLTSGQSDERIREFFNSFYFCINVGALGSFALIPLVRANFGFGASFCIPTISMIVALAIFRSFRDKYKHRRRDPAQPSLLHVFRVSFRILKTRLAQTRVCMACASLLGMNLLSAPTHSVVPLDEDSNYQFAQQRISAQEEVYQDASQALHLLPLMAFFPIFWMLYDQQGSVWTLQATRLNLHGLEPEQLQVLNPLEIMIFIPLFDRKIYPCLERRGVNIQPLRRMEYGMFLTAVSFAASAILELHIQSNPPFVISVLWQIPQITILTIAEILLNVTGLEFAYSQAPSNMQALILALYLFTTAIGDGLGAALYGSIFSLLSTTASMFICAICMLLNMLLFARVARRWKPYHYQVGDDDGFELGQVHNMQHQN